jgi:small subunit ribosomal protein S17
MPKRILRGKVVCNKADKTANVLVITKRLHPKYKKYINYSKKFLAHDELNQCSVGEEVSIQEHKPLSKRKCWVVLGDAKGSQV